MGRVINEISQEFLDSVNTNEISFYCEKETDARELLKQLDSLGYIWGRSHSKLTSHTCFCNTNGTIYTITKTPQTLYHHSLQPGFIFNFIFEASKSNLVEDNIKSIETSVLYKCKELFGIIRNETDLNKIGSIIDTINELIKTKNKVLDDFNILDKK